MTPVCRVSCRVPVEKTTFSKIQLISYNVLRLNVFFANSRPIHEFQKKYIHFPILFTFFSSREAQSLNSIYRGCAHSVPTLSLPPQLYILNAAQLK